MTVALFRRKKWNPRRLGSSLAAWYRADAGCYTDAACLFASASSQYLSKTSPTFAPTTKMTIRVSYNQASTAAHTIAARWGGGQDQFIISVQATGLIRVYVAEGGTSDGSHYADGSTVLSDNTPYEIVVVYDGTLAAGSRVAIYVNGVAETLTINSAIPAALTVSTAPLEIGYVTNVWHMDGTICRLGFSSLALSGAALTAAHTSTFWADMTAARQADWFSFYNLCEASGTRVDSTGLNNLTPTNGPTVAAGPGEGACVDNSPCKRITDQSANGIDLTFPAMASQFLWKANQQNGRPMLIPDGVDDYASAVVGPALVRVWGGVWKFIDNVALQGLLCDGVDTYSIRRDTGLDYRGFATSNAGDFLNNGGTLRIDGVQTDSIASYDVANGYVAESVDNGDYATLGFRVGVCGGIGLGRLWKGGIGELYASSRAVTAGERSGMETYNRTRWGTA